MKLLLVDDEPLSLRSLERMLKRLPELPLEIVGKAQNGQEALKAVQAFHPDVVITDVRMPVMDGIRLVQELNRNHPEIISVVLSAYMEFQYARDALRQNVADYLLKPVEPSDLLQLLQRLQHHVRQKQKEACETYLRGGKARALSDGAEAKYWITGAHLGPLRSRIDSENTASSRITFQRWEQVLCRDFPSALLIELPKRNECLILEPKPQAAELPQALSREAGTFVTFMRYPRNVPMSMLGVVLGEIQNNLHQRVVLAKTQVLSTEDTPPVIPEPLKKLSDTVCRRIIFCAENMDLSGMSHLLKDLFEEARQTDLPQYLAEDLAWQILHLLRRFILQRDEQYDLREIISELAANSADTTIFGDKLWGVLQEYMRTADPGGKRSDEAAYSAVICFIRQNLTQQLSLEQVCARFGLSQTRLSRLFRRYSQMSFNEYITQTRIRYARQLLLTQPSLRIREIAVMTGYGDQHYFSRVFKNITGVSPSEYRLQEQAAGK